MNGLHFSDLKHFAESPAHFEYAIKHPKPMTAPMRVGMIVDRILTGGKVPPTYPGSPDGNMARQGKAWSDWAAKQNGWQLDELATRGESDEADAIAEAVVQNALAMEYLTGRPQVPLRWKAMGIERETRGVDVVGQRWITDLKVSHTAKPDTLMRHAESMLWHAQLADYREACRQNGIATDQGVFLVVIESKPPYVATVMRVSDSMLEAGERCIHLWLEKYKAHKASNVWPGYSQTVVDWVPWEERNPLGRMPELTGFDE